MDEAELYWKVARLLRRDGSRGGSTPQELGARKAAALLALHVGKSADTIRKILAALPEDPKNRERLARAGGGTGAIGHPPREPAGARHALAAGHRRPRGRGPLEPGERGPPGRAALLGRPGGRPGGPVHGHPGGRPAQRGPPSLLPAAPPRRETQESRPRRLHAEAAHNPQRDGKAPEGMEASGNGGLIVPLDTEHSCLAVGVN